MKLNQSLQLNNILEEYFFYLLPEISSWFLEMRTLPFFTCQNNVFFMEV